MRERARASAGPDRPVIGDGWASALTCERDWSETPLGPIERWPASLTAAVQVMLASRQPMFVWWGEDLVQLGNLAFRVLFSARLNANGEPARELWKSVWDQAGAGVEAVMNQRPGSTPDQILLVNDMPTQQGNVQHCFALNPLADANGGVCGVLGVYEGSLNSLQSVNGARPHILLAESDAEMRDYICRLAGAAYDVTAVANGNDALRAARDQKPDLMLIDASLAGTNGDGLASDLRTDQRTRDVPVMLLTTDQGNTPDVLELDSSDRLVKPFSARELLARIDAQIRTARARQEAAEREAMVRADVSDERSRVEAALRQSERRYRQVVQGLPAAVYTCDAEGRLQLYNDAAVALWGQTPEIGRSMWCGSYRIYAADGTPLPLDQCPMSVTLREGRAVRGVEIVIERPDGIRRRVLPHPEPLFDVSGKLIGAVNMLVDITERKQAEAELAATKDDLALEVKALKRLHDLAVHLTGAAEQEPSLEAILQTLVETHEADFGLISLYDAGSGCLRAGASIGLDHEARAALAEVEPGPEAGACGAAFATKQPAIVEDVETDLQCEGVRDTARKVGFRAVHSTPIVTRAGEVLGVISVHFRAPRRPTARERQLADLCARHAADVLETLLSQQALRESEERFGMFMQHLPGLAWIKGVDGRYVFVNDAAERAFQKSRAELYGKVDEEIFPPETAARFRQNDREALAGAVETVETLDQDDGLHHSLVSKFSIPDANGRPSMIGGIAIDVTERVQAEQALRDSEERFRAITMNAPVAIFIKDLEGRYTLCNPLASQALGRPHGAVGFTDHDLLPAPAADQIRRRDLEVISSGQPSESEEVVPLGGVDRQFLAAKFPLRNAIGETVGVCGVAVDITERKQAQFALRESERRLLLATQTGKVGVWAWDLAANRVSWSESLQTIVGLSPADLASTVENFETLVHPEDRQRVQEAIQHALARDDSLELEFRAIHSDGDFIWLFTNASILREGGQPVRMLGATLDITERKHGEIALRESEERFRTLASHAPVGIFQSDAEGRTIFVNEGWCEMAGVSPEQARGDGWAMTIHPDDVERVTTRWNEAVRAGEASHAEFRFLQPDGRITWLQGNAVPLRDPASQVAGYIGTIVDITGRKEVEAALRNSERMYRAIGESIDYGIWVCDPEGRNIYSSESFLKLVGLTQEQCSNHGWAEVLHPDDVEQTMAAWQECVRMEDSWDIEHRFRGVDGQWHPILARGVPVRSDRGEIIAWVGINLDISELKQVENDLRESEARFRNVADNAPVLIWMNGAGGCQFVNKEYLTFVGRPLDEILGMGWTDLIHAQDLNPYLESYLGAFERKQAFDAQVRMRRADGEYRWLSSTAAPRFRADGAFLGYIGCSVDITDIKASEEALREADRRKDDFLAMLGHELRNPLAGIVTGAQVLSMMDLDNEAGEMQAVIARQASYMSRIVDDLLDVSRIARGKLRLRHQHANLRLLLRDAVEDYRKGHAQESCELRINIPDADVWIWADTARLAQAFSNIIHNGCKFGEGPNVVTVDLSADSNARQATAVISDHGIGMAPETIARIFEPFTQADTSLERSRGGLGLGLALARGLIHLHGGSVTATSAGLGQGSTFTITLPYVAAPKESDPHAQLPAAASRRVLIIDDRRDAILPLQKMLEMDGHLVATAENGPAGLERAADFRPDIVLCDIGLIGDMNGYGVSRALRAMSDMSSTYLVAVTGYGHEEARRMAKEAGFNYHVTKPVSKQQIRELVSRMPTF